MPDLTLAQSRYRAAQHELWRRERSESLEAERDFLQGEVERLGRCVAKLEARAEAEGWESVHPILRR